MPPRHVVTNADACIHLAYPGEDDDEREHRVLDHTHGNLKAAQKLLGHSSISTTGDIYTDWDIDQLAETLRGMYEDAET